MNKIIVLDPVTQVQRKQHGGISVYIDEVFCYDLVKLP
jgi:hypothetical protein